VEADGAAGGRPRGRESGGGLIGGNDEVRVADGSENADPEEGVDGHGVSVARTVA